MPPPPPPPPPPANDTHLPSTLAITGRLVWQGTQRVGCAAVVCPMLDGIKYDFTDVDFVVW